MLSKSRTFQLFGDIVHRVDTDRKVVALTFDDGPLNESVDEILEALRGEKVKATFFVCGAEIEQNPEAAAKLVAAGHALGNHSYSHVRMWFKPPSFYAEEFEKTDALIRAAGYTGSIYVRAPYCKKLVGLPRYFAKTGRVHVTFDVEPETDPEIDRSFTRIFSHVVENVRPGSIVLLHPWYRNREHSRAAVPLIVKTLKRAGYEFVTVDELLEHRVSSRAQSRDPLRRHEARSVGRGSLDCARDDRDHKS
ncbi:MAG TPA: polysaccharide deacetylase family protein [Thermoanaerobaculia bacterium]|nr:polysaccharide deacetylase family protein [Thermoanaerobaculia bacterium]